MITQRRYGEFTTLDTRGESNESVDKAKRYIQITEILHEHIEPMSAKEIAVEMYRKGYTPTSERNFASPRITELLQNGKLEVVGKKKCEYSGKSVSVFTIRNEQV